MPRARPRPRGVRRDSQSRIAQTRADARPGDRAQRWQVNNFAHAPTLAADAACARERHGYGHAGWLQCVPRPRAPAPHASLTGVCPRVQPWPRRFASTWSVIPLSSSRARLDFSVSADMRAHHCWRAAEKCGRGTERRTISWPDRPIARCCARLSRSSYFWRWRARKGGGGDELCVPNQAPVPEGVGGDCRGQRVDISRCARSGDPSAPALSAEVVNT